MTAAYPIPDERHRAPDPNRIVAMQAAINGAAVKLHDYALLRDLELPVLLSTVIGDTFYPKVTVEDLAMAEVMYSELMQMDYEQAMVMPYSVMNGPVRTCFATYLQEHDMRWESVRADATTALLKRYREGIDGRHSGKAGQEGQPRV